MITDSEMDGVFQALAHATRREILDHLRDQPGIPVGQLAQKFDVSRIAVMAHLGVLERANLIVSRKEGRSRKLFLNAVPIQQIHERWTDTFSEQFASRVTTLKQVAEMAARQGD